MTKKLGIIQAIFGPIPAWKDAVAYCPALALRNVLYPGIYIGEFLV